MHRSKKLIENISFFGNHPRSYTNSGSIHQWKDCCSPNNCNSASIHAWLFSYLSVQKIGSKNLSPTSDSKIIKACCFFHLKINRSQNCFFAPLSPSPHLPVFVPIFGMVFGYFIRFHERRLIYNVYSWEFLSYIEKFRCVFLFLFFCFRRLTISLLDGEVLPYLDLVWNFLSASRGDGTESSFLSIFRWDRMSENKSICLDISTKL